MTRLRRWVFGPLLALAVGAPLHGQDGPSAAPASAVSLGISTFDVSGHLGHGAAVEVAYRPAWGLSRRIRPDFGGMVTSAGGTYGYVGVRSPLSVHPRLEVTPSLAAGAFGGGRAEDLGSAVEFRSGIELGLLWAADRSVGLFFYHLSNAGLGRRNPGMEVLGLGYSIAL